MELFLVRFLVGGTMLLALGLVLAQALYRWRGASAAGDALRYTLAALLAAAALAALPAPLPAVAELPRAPSIAPLEEVTFSAPTMATSAPLAPAPPQPRPFPWLPLMFLLWGVGALVGSLVLLRGHFLLRRLRQQSTPAQAAVPSGLTVRQSALLSTPLLAGVLRPVLYLPTVGPLYTEPNALAAALAHELAHWRRHDLRWSVAASLVRTLLWFHPLAHVLVHQLGQLAEEACDLDAVAVVQDRRAYADLLLRLSTSSPTLSAPVVGMAVFRSHVGKRIHALLAHRLSVPLTRGGRLFLACIMASALCIGTALIGKAQPPRSLAPSRPTPARVLTSYSLSKVSISVKDRPVGEVIAQLQQRAKAKIELAPGLTGRVTLKVEKQYLHELLPALCAQLRPTAWFIRTFTIGENQEAYRIIVSPAGTLQGRIIGPDRKPLAGVIVDAYPQLTVAQRQAKERTVGVLQARSDSQGRYTLQHVGNYPYELVLNPKGKPELPMIRTEVVGQAKQVTNVPDLRLPRAATVEVLIQTDEPGQPTLYPSFKLPGRINARRVKPIGPFSQPQVFLLPPGQVTIEASWNRTPKPALSVLRVDGPRTPTVQGSSVVLQVAEGELVRLQLKATLTPEQKAQRAQNQALLEKVREANQQRSQSFSLQFRRVNLPTGPQPFAPLVESLAKQAGVSQVVIAPGIQGTVKADLKEAYLRQALETLCPQTTPPSFPIWKGAALYLVAAPAPGQLDSVHHLYRLKGIVDPVVFEESEHESGGGGRYGIYYANYDSPTQRQIRVTNYQTDKPLAGVTVFRETHGNVERFQTSADGQVTIPMRRGRNYVYPEPGAGIPFASGSQTSMGKSTTYWGMIPNTAEAKRIQAQWQTRVSLSAKQLPFREAVDALCKQAGFTQIDFPKGVTGTVTLELKSVPLSIALSQVCRQVKRGLIVEQKARVQFRQFNVPRR